MRSSVSRIRALAQPASSPAWRARWRRAATCVAACSNFCSPTRRSTSAHPGVAVGAAWTGDGAPPTIKMPASPATRGPRPQLRCANRDPTMVGTLSQRRPRLRPLGGATLLMIKSRLVKRSVTVQVAGQRYTLKTDDDERLVKSLASYVDAKFRDIQKATRNQDTQAVAILTALQVAEELFQVRAESADLKKRVGDKTRALLDYLAKVGRV